MAVRFILGAAALGAAAMFMLDPDHGRRRRAVARQQVASRLNRVGDAAAVAGRDLRNRARGTIWELRSRFDAERNVPDEVLAERVRSRLGRSVSHPGAIEVQGSAGRVILSGAVLEREYLRLLRSVCSVRGVVDVEDRLAVYDSARGISALQGEGKPPGSRFDLLQQNWSPATRVLVGAVGCALLAHAFSKRRRGLRLLSGVAGASLLVRTATNMPLTRLVGARRPAVDVQKVIDVDAPVEQVFETFSHYENFPQFMTNVRDVRMSEDGTSHWRVAGPAGQSIEWDALTTRLEPNRLIAWRTLPGSAIEHAGLVRFEPANSGTRVVIRMSYTPPAGALGHAVAKLFGADPKSELDDDLLRLKVFLETGKRPHDAAAARH